MTNGVILILGFYLLFVSIPLVELEQHTTISWYLLQFNWLNFNIVSAMAFLAWLLIAAYRLMRQELQYKNSPLVWTIFVLFVLFYCAGFLLDINLANSYELSKFSNSLVYLQSLAPYLFVLMILISWLSIYFSDNSLPVFHRFIYACSEKKLSQIWLYCPLWLVTYVFLIVSAFWLYLNTSFNPAVDILSSLWFGQTSLYHPDFILLCLLFVLRDILISIYFNFKNAFNRPDSSALVFIILLYVLLPSILNLTLGKQWLFIFLPIFYEQTWFNLVPVVFQVVLMLFLVIRLYKQKSP